jgi:hypothetical protein
MRVRREVRRSIGGRGSVLKIDLAAAAGAPTRRSRLAHDNNTCIGALRIADPLLRPENPEFSRSLPEAGAERGLVPSEDVRLDCRRVAIPHPVVHLEGGPRRSRREKRLVAAAEDERSCGRCSDDDDALCPATPSSRSVDRKMFGESAHERHEVRSAYLRSAVAGARTSRDTRPRHEPRQLTPATGADRASPLATDDR